MAVTTREWFRPADLLRSDVSFQGLERLLKAKGCCHCHLTIAPYAQAVAVEDEEGEQGLVHRSCLNEQPVDVLEPSRAVVGEILGFAVARR